MANYSQTDPRWSNEKLGNSTQKDGTIGNKGCAVTALCNFYNRVFGTDINPSQLNKLLTDNGGYLLSSGYSIVLWGNVYKSLPKLRFVSRDWNYSNGLVWSWINVNPRLPVIVCAKTSFSPQHFFVFIGGGRMVDSEDGREKSTSTYPVLTGSVRYAKA